MYGFRLYRTDCQAENSLSPTLSRTQIIIKRNVNDSWTIINIVIISIHAS